jgi:predicted membrane protein
LMVFTKGFRVAPKWGLRAIFSELIAGLVLPIMVLTLNF